MEPIYKNIGSYLRKARRSANLSLAETAKKSGMSRSNLNAIELGTQRAQLHQLHKLCRLLKIQFKVNVFKESDSKHRGNNNHHEQK